MKDITNPIIFRAALPSMASVANHLQDIPFSEMPVGSTLLSASGFVSNPVSGELVTPIGCGFSFVLRHDEKVIPPAEVKKEVQSRVDAMVNSGIPVSRKEKAAIKDDVICILAARAFTRSTMVVCHYHEKAGLLFVAGSEKMAQLAMRLLVRCVGSVKTQTIHIDGIKKGLTSALKGYIQECDLHGEGESAFAGLTVGGDIKLALPGTTEELSFSSIEPTDNAELLSALARDFVVQSIRLHDGNALSLTLDHCFRFKSLKWPKADRSPDADEAFQWRSNATLQVMALADLVERLCALLGYQEPSEGEASPIAAE